MKKWYVVEGTELTSFRTWVESEKHPDEFETLEEFYNQSDNSGDWKTTGGEIQSIENAEESE